ncbi:hypothetical protein HGA88_02665 [Candidatus Roizmanbacteria bacterium]|nr:hypothetical protein [Candidatus Roizmanbacteria bacterium]
METDKLLLQAIDNNDFFHDFIVFLKYLEEQPIKRTVTGNISLADIAALQKRFRQQRIFEQFKEFNWKINSERVVEFLTQIKIIAEAMYVTYKRRDKLILSKNGRGYLHNIDATTQYLNMVIHYWKRVNWDYFSPSPYKEKISVMNILQENQDIIWEAISRKGEEWIDFDTFCHTLKAYFHLDTFYNKDNEYSYHLDIEYGLLKKNLVRFGCVEFKEEADKYNFKRIVQFRATKLGLFVFQSRLLSVISNGMYVM